MAAAHQQRHEREVRTVLFQHRRQQVPLHMVHRHRRQAPAVGQAAADAGAHQQRPGQPRAGGERHTVELLRGSAGLAHHLAHQRQQPAHMVAAGQLRHHAAVGGMHVDLAVQRLAEQALFGVEDGHAGLVTAGFDAQYAHGDSLNKEAHDTAKPASLHFLRAQVEFAPCCPGPPPEPLSALINPISR